MFEKAERTCLWEHTISFYGGMIPLCVALKPQGGSKLTVLGYVEWEYFYPSVPSGMGW